MTLRPSELRNQGENELPQVPQDSFSQPALLPFLQPPTAQTGRPGFDQHELPSPRSACTVTSTERWKAVEWAKTRDFSCRTPHLWRQDGICKPTRDYPRCQLQQRASNFATSKGRVSATCSPKTRSGNSSAGSAEGPRGLTPCPSSVAFRAPGWNRNTAFLQFLSPPSIQC